MKSNPIRIELEGRRLKLAEAIIALLREREALGTCYIGEPRDDDGIAWFTVFWEGTDASPFFSLDHCCPPGGCEPEAYEPWETMLQLCAEHNCHPWQNWGASPVYRGLG
tara:strand:- start:52 stop:378 length:327 start_codon:yes stop_codon:yes gene_type:complete